MTINQLSFADRQRLPESVKGIEAINQDAFLSAAETWLAANPLAGGGTNREAVKASYLARYERGEIGTAGSPLLPVSDVEALPSEAQINFTYQILSKEPKDRPVRGEVRAYVKVKITGATSQNVSSNVTDKILGKSSTLYLNGEAFSAWKKDEFLPFQGTTGKAQITVVDTEQRRGLWPQMVF